MNESLTLKIYLRIMIFKRSNIKRGFHLFRKDYFYMKDKQDKLEEELGLKSNFLIISSKYKNFQKEGKMKGVLILK